MPHPCGGAAGKRPSSGGQRGALRVGASLGWQAEACPTHAAELPGKGQAPGGNAEPYASELRSDGKLKHAPPMRRSCLEKAKLRCTRRSLTRPSFARMAS